MTREGKEEEEEGELVDFGALGWQGDKLKATLSSWKMIVGEVRRCGQGVITVADFVRRRQAGSRSSVEAFAFVYLSTSQRPSSIRVALLQKLVNPWCACALCTSSSSSSSNSSPSASQEVEMPTLRSLLPRLSWLTARIAKSDGYQLDDDDTTTTTAAAAVAKPYYQASLSESPLGLLGEDVLREEILYRQV